MSARSRFRARWLLLVWIAGVAHAAPPTAISDCSDCPRMVTIPGGTFTMGSPQSELERRKFEGPQPGVTVATFAIGETEVTRAQYAAFVQDTNRAAEGGCLTYGFSTFRDETAIDKSASWRNPGFDQTPEHPVVCVSGRTPRTTPPGSRARRGVPIACRAKQSGNTRRVPETCRRTE